MQNLDQHIILSDDFSKIFNKYYAKVNRHVRELLDCSDVDDIVQEIFLKVEKGLPEFQGNSKLSTWIHRITVNHCIDCKRQRKVKRTYVNSYKQVDFNDGTSYNYNVEEEAINKEMNLCIRNYIYQLPSDFKEVILLSDIEGFTNKEIAERLRISLDLVKIRLHRGRVKLKNILTKQCCLYYNEDNELACEQK